MNADEILKLVQQVRDAPLYTFIVVCALIATLIGWYLKAYLTEKGKQHASPPKPPESYPVDHAANSVAPPDTCAVTASDTKGSAPKVTIRFSGTFVVDPVNLKRVLDAFPAYSHSFDIEWPSESDALLVGIGSLYSDAERYTEKESTFYGVPPNLVRSFMDWSERHRRASEDRERVASRIGYLMETVNRSKLLSPWRERVLTQFLKLANYLLYTDLTQCWFLHQGLPPSVRERLPAEWRALMLRGDEQEAHLLHVMNWETPIFRQNVIELSGRRMNRYFYVPKAYVST